MYFRLTSSLKRRVIEELRRFWSYHPKYPDLTGNIQGKFSFQERPNYGIVVKTSGGNRVDLASDNFVGTVESYIFLTKVTGYDGLAVEWVREDEKAIQKNRGLFPSPPGIYYVDLVEDEQFYVDALLDARRELVMMTDSSHGMLVNPPVMGTLRLYEQPQGFMLLENINYTLTLDQSGNPTGEIVLVNPLTNGRALSADYRYPGPTTGPFPLVPNHANNTAVPGVVLAFGNKNKKGDRMAVVVQEFRYPSALEYGGRMNITLDIDINARDVESEQEIADQTVIYLWGILRSRLSSEGIEMTDLQLGGESEEPYDENGDDYFYNAAFTLTLESEWSVHIPLALFLRSVSDLTVAQAQLAAALPDDQVAQVSSNIKMVENLGLEAVRDPFFQGRTSTFEAIK